MAGDSRHNLQRRPGVGVGALVIRDDQILLIRRQAVHGDGTWSTPGGHLDFAESPESCAVRETREETGIVVHRPVFRGITNDHFVDEGRHYVTLWIQAEYESGVAAVGAPEEMSDVGWFRLSALPKPLFLSLRNLVENRSAPPGIFVGLRPGAPPGAT